MSLEEEIRAQIRRDTISAPQVAEFVVGKPAPADIEDVLNVILAKLNALETAVYRLANGVDDARSLDRMEP